MDMAKLARLGVLLVLGDSSWPLLPLVCERFPKRFGGSSGAAVPLPNSCNSAGGGYDGGGVGEKDEAAGVIKLGPVVGLGIREAPKYEVSSGVMVRSVGSFAVELFALRRLAGPDGKDGDAGRERC